MSEFGSLRSKILKLLSLTTSDNDHEALSAVRRANSLLKGADFTWLSLFGETPPSNQPEDLDEDLHKMVSYIKEYAWSAFDIRFIRSVESLLEGNARLSQKQNIRLREIYEQLKGR